MQRGAQRPTLVGDYVDGGAEELEPGCSLSCVDAAGRGRRAMLGRWVGTRQRQSLARQSSRTQAAQELAARRCKLSGVLRPRRRPVDGRGEPCWIRPRINHIKLDEHTHKELSPKARIVPCLFPAYFSTLNSAV
jgi:hypothetical protein